MNWMKRAGRAVLMGIMWATAWSPIGPIIGFIVDRDGKMDEPWIAVGVLPGFACGVFFSIALALAERGRRFDQLSLSRIAAWGGVAGAVVGLLPFVLGDPCCGKDVSLLAYLMPIIVGVASAASSAGTLMLARKAEFNFVDDQPVA
jgi:hypothetical protein